MNDRRWPLILLFTLAGACTSTNYSSPAPSREEVQEVRAQVEEINPQRRELTLAEASALATPIFHSIAEDAARICRTVSEADSCRVPAFEITDESNVNAGAGYTLRNEPEISLTRGLVEYLADQPDELALVIGHEYGHLITAHVEEAPKPDDGTGQSIVGAALSVLAASGAAVSSGNASASVRYQRRAGPAYSQREIDEYLADTDPEGAYAWFSRGEELEADYIGTYLATRSGYAPTGAAFLEIGALKNRDELSPLQKRDQKIAYAYWDTHPYSPDRAARITATLEEIEQLKAKGYPRPLPPQLIVDIQDNNAAFHSLEELIAPLPDTPEVSRP